MCRPMRSHKSLGRIYAGDPTKRRHPGFQHRVQLDWAKFHQYRTVLTNKHVSIKLRLKLFDAVVTPRVLFGLVTNAADTKTINSTRNTANTDDEIYCWFVFGRQPPLQHLHLMVQPTPRNNYNQWYQNHQAPGVFSCTIHSLASTQLIF